jgi:hypothetical protein
MSAERGCFMHAVGEAGAVFGDWAHDGDFLSYGRCYCGWHDPIDHIDIHVAEQMLLDHAKGHP